MFTSSEIFLVPYEIEKPDVIERTRFQLPDRKPIIGRFIKAEPLDIEKHIDQLFELHTQPDMEERLRWTGYRCPPKDRRSFADSLTKMVENEKNGTERNYVYYDLGKLLKWGSSF